MNSEKETEAFYERLQNELDFNSSWPSSYLFKFILPTGNDGILQIEESFNDMGAVIKTKMSKTGKFTSVSIDVVMNNSTSIINKYKELTAIKGIISL